MKQTTAQEEIFLQIELLQQELMCQHILKEMTRLEESRDTLKELHSTLQDPGLLWKSHILSPVSTALRKISTDHQRIQPQSDPSLLAHCFQRKDYIRNKLEIQRTPHKLLRSLTSFTKWTKQHGGRYVGEQELFCQLLSRALTCRLHMWCGIWQGRLCHTAIQTDHTQKPKILSLVQSWRWPHITYKCCWR